MKTSDDGIDLLLAELDPHQKEIETNESASILARWKFGQELRKQIPEGKKQLPKGLREKVAKHYNVEASEITRRMQLARDFDSREKVEAACTKHGGSWRRIIREELVNHREDGPPEVSLWVDRAKSRLDKLVREAGESDEQHDELVNLLVLSLRTLGYDVVETES